MRDDASRARLQEMGFELYVPRGVRSAAVAGRTVAAASRARVVLIARGENALIAQVARALAFARIDAPIASDASRIGDAAGLVVFGAPLAREVGAAVPAERQASIGWVGAADPAEIAGNGAAKRALWSELKRLARGLERP